MQIFEKLPTIALSQSEPDYDCHNGAVMRLYRDTEKIDFENAVDAYIADGFSLYNSVTVEGNCSSVLTRDGVSVFVFRSECDRIMRITADAYTALPEKNEQPCKAAVKPYFFQFETDHSLIDCGMCYVLQLRDGSFFVIDSAHSYSVNDNDRIYDFLKKLTPDGEKIIISGWFFTHGHSDHICKFMDFLRFNRENVEIKGIYYNFVSPEHRDSVDWDESEKSRIRNFVSLVDSHPEIPKYKLHSLERFYVGNAKMTVLTTHEDVYPLSVSDFNDSSTALMIEVEGTKILIPGDSCRNSSYVMTSRFKDYLKCDILQLSHHGHTGCKSEFYSLAEGKTLLIPNTKIKYDEEWDRREENRLAEKLCSVSYISSQGSVGIPLPYGSGENVLFPDETTENFEGIYDLWAYEYTDEFKENVNKEFTKNSTRKAVVL